MTKDVREANDPREKPIMAATTIPVTITEEATARVAELGMQPEFEQMLERVRQIVSGLRSMRVTLEFDPACPENEPGIAIWAYRDDLPTGSPIDYTDWHWGEWQSATFPPNVCRHFVMVSLYGASNGW
jgi:hypothetical protein